MKFKTFKLLYTYLASAVYLIPIFYLFKDMFNHKDLRIDFIFIFTVLIFRATLYAEFAIKMILEIISQPQKVTITDRTIDMDNVDLFIKAKETDG